MTNASKTSSIRIETVKAVEIILSLFTNEQKEVLAIKNGDIKITLVEQFLARWWNYIPIDDVPFVLRGKAAKIIAAHKHYIDLVDKFDKGELTKHLIDPESYKKITDSDFKFKKISKRGAMGETTSSGLARVLAKTLGGKSGLSEVYDFASDWDAVDRKRLDAVKFKPIKLSKLEYKNSETGEEDHAVEKDWMKQNESLENLIITKQESENKAVEFNSDIGSLGTANMSIHEASLSQSSNLTASQNNINTFSFSEGVNKGGGTKARIEYTTASNVYKIQAIEFVDIREQFYRRFDSLFVWAKNKKCQ